MDGKRDRPDGAKLLPDGALPCVWMTAGLLAHRLCDREVDCDHCPLDAALRGVEPAGEEPEAVGEVPDLEWEFRADRQYSLSHWWVQSLGEGRVRYGLDAFAARLLGHVTSTIFPTEGSPLLRGEPACWLLDDAELIPLRSPLTGSLLRTNRRLQENPALIGTSSYDKGWLLEARCEGNLDRQKHLIDAAAMRRRAAHDLRDLYREVSSHLQKGSAVGPTLADGGQRLTELRGILGTERYHQLIRSLLG